MKEAGIKPIRHVSNHCHPAICEQRMSLSIRKQKNMCLVSGSKLPQSWVHSCAELYKVKSSRQKGHDVQKFLVGFATFISNTKSLQICFSCKILSQCYVIKYITLSHMLFKTSHSLEDWILKQLYSVNCECAFSGNVHIHTLE